MRSVLAGIGLMIVVSAVAWWVTETQKTSSSAAYSSTSGSVRLDD